MHYKFKEVLLEFSEPRARIEERIMNVEEQIFQHLIKLYVSPKNSSAEHWKDEIYAFVTRFSRIKWARSKKQLSPEFYYKNLVLGPLTNSNEVGDWNISGIKMELEVIASRYKNMKNIATLDIDKMMIVVDAFYRELCVLVSKNEITNISVNSLLKNFFQK